MSEVEIFAKAQEMVRDATLQVVIESVQALDAKIDRLAELQVAAGSDYYLSPPIKVDSIVPWPELPIHERRGVWLAYVKGGGA